MCVRLCCHYACFERQNTSGVTESPCGASSVDIYTHPLANCWFTAVFTRRQKQHGSLPQQHRLLCKSTGFKLSMVIGFATVMSNDGSMAALITTKASFSHSLICVSLPMPVSWVSTAQGLDQGCCLSKFPQTTIADGNRTMHTHILYTDAFT